MVIRSKMTWIGCGVLAFFCAAVKDTLLAFQERFMLRWETGSGAEFDEPDADRDDLPAVAPVA